MNALFICSKNKLRSPTAEHVATQMGVEADSAGLAPDATQVLHSDQLIWADTIFVMESRHKSKLTQKYSKYLKDKKIITLNILDNYDYMQPELIEILEKRLPQFLKVKQPKFKIK